MKELQKRITELNKNDEDNVKVVEKGGLKLKIILCSKESIQNIWL